MTTESLSAFVVRKLSIPSAQEAPQTYYRSKLFTAPFSTNPLLDAANPLLSLIERLHISPSLPNVNTIHENIEHELRAFHSRLAGKTCSEELNAIAYYLLCATIDELLGKSYLRLYEQAAPFQAFTPLSHDGIGPEQRFFDIIHYVKARPNQYLDLIELAYYCLITGFEGQYHQQADGRLLLDNLIDDLFQLIQQHRVNKAHNLFTETKKIPLSSSSHKQVTIVSFISLSLLLLGFTLSHTLLEHKAKAIQLGHTVIAKLDD